MHNVQLKITTCKYNFHPCIYMLMGTWFKRGVFKQLLIIDMPYLSHQLFSF